MASEPGIPVCGDVSWLIPKGAKPGKQLRTRARVLSSDGYGKVGPHTIPRQRRALLGTHLFFKHLDHVVSGDESCVARTIAIRAWLGKCKGGIVSRVVP